MQPRRVLFTILAVSGLAGCASLDPAPDVARSADLVQARAGVAPAWTGPWTRELEDWDPSTPLTSERAVLLALRNNRELRRQVELIGVSRADLVQAGLLPNPVLSVSLGFPVDPVSGSTQVAAGAVQDLVALWLRPRRLEAADARLNESVLALSDAALRLVADVKQTHARVVAAGESIALSRESLRTVDHTLEALAARVKAGEGTQLDVNRAMQQRLVLGAELTRQELELERQKRSLLALMGFAGAPAGWGVATGAPTTSGPLPSEERVIAMATSERLDVAAAYELARAHSADLSAEERARLDHLAVGLGFERNEAGESFLGPELEISIPIFDFNQARIAKAGSLARAAAIGYEAALQRAVAQARRAYVDAARAGELAEGYAARSVALAESNQRLAESALSAGQADTTVILSAQQSLIEARRALSDLRQDALIARIELEYAVGGLLAPQGAPAGGAEGASR